MAPSKSKVKGTRTANAGNAAEWATFQNGLSDAIFGFNPVGLGTQISQVDTLFQNERWELISNMRQILAQMYVEHGLVQTVIDVPVDDGLRGGVEIKSKQLSPEQIEQLLTWMDREDILGSGMGQALKWNRLFGGAGILIQTGQDPSTPLDILALNEDAPFALKAVDMWELFYSRQNLEGYDPAKQEQGFEFYNYYGVTLHKSRVRKLKGLTAPSFLRPRLRGWGFSVIESLVRPLNQYLKTGNLIFEVLDEFKIDIFKIDGFNQSLITAKGSEAINKRLALANQQKNFQKGMAMDAKDDFLQKQLTFTGLADIIKENRIQLASELRMPLTKLFGLSATGFNSGDDDIENYNAMVESQVRAKAKYDILFLLELGAQINFGFIPDDMQISFKPLRILSAAEEENVKTQKFNRLLAARSAGFIDSKAFKDGCNKDSLLPVQLDTSDEALDIDSEDEGGEDAGNRDDTEKTEETP